MKIIHRGCHSPKIVRIDTLFVSTESDMRVDAGVILKVTNVVQSVSRVVFCKQIAVYNKCLFNQELKHVYLMKKAVDRAGKMVEDYNSLLCDTPEGVGVEEHEELLENERSVKLVLVKAMFQLERKCMDPVEHDLMTDEKEQRIFNAF